MQAFFAKRVGDCRCDIAQKGKCLPCCDEMLEGGFLLHGKNNNYFLALKNFQIHSYVAYNLEYFEHRLLAANYNFIVKKEEKCWQKNRCNLELI